MALFGVIGDGDEQMIDSTALDVEVDSNYAKPKRVALVALLLCSACIGGISVFLPDDPAIDRLTDYLFGLPLVFLVLGWCHYDALDKHYIMSRSMRFCLLLLLGIAFPIYLFRSRGIAAFKALALSVLFLGLMVLTAILAAMPCYGVGYLLGIVE